MAAKRRVLSIAAASGRVGYIMLSDDELTVLGLSRKASTGADEAAMFTANLIEQTRPAVVVTELIGERSRKSAKSQCVINAIADIARVARLDDVRVLRTQAFANKYEEAAALAAAYPMLKQSLPPKRKFYESEPKAIAYFEALSMALVALERPITPDSIT